MTSSSEQVAGASVLNKSEELGIDSHLLLNALNHIGLETYQLTGREIPLVEVLSDYIKAEYSFNAVRTVNGGLFSIGQEWERCKAMLEVKACLMSVSVQFVEAGDRHGLAFGYLATVISGVFGGWPAIYRGRLELGLRVEQALVVITGRVFEEVVDSLAPKPFAAEILRRMKDRGSLHKDVQIEVLNDDEAFWALALRP